MQNRIKELREAKGITQLNLAVRVGTTQQTISKLEKFETVPRLNLALDLADYFNVSLEYLFCLSDKKYRVEHQIKIDKAIEDYYEFFMEYQSLDDINKETLNLIIRRLREVQDLLKCK